jgi:cell division septal protein FtsQ
MYMYIYINIDVYIYIYPLSEVKVEGDSAFSLDDMLASVAHNQNSSDERKYFCI